MPEIVRIIHGALDNSTNWFRCPFGVHTRCVEFVVTILKEQVDDLLAPFDVGSPYPILPSLAKSHRSLQDASEMQ